MARKINVKIFGTIGISLLFQLPFAVAQVKDANPIKKRCGWYDNPTPSNSSLYDKDGEWLISVQGGHHAKGGYAPLFSKKAWIVTNSGNYGYGCACFRMSVDEVTHQVLFIKNSYAKPLSVCRQDSTLNRWSSLFS